MSAAEPPDAESMRCVPDAAPAPAKRVDSTTLLGGTRELIIEHGPDAYRLRLTSKGKLILTK